MTVLQSPELEESYWVDYSNVIGRGNGTTVRQCYGKKSRDKFAVKTVNKRLTKAVEFLRNEIEIMREVSDHKNINTLVAVIEDEKQIHLISELCRGGHLGHLIEENITLNPKPDYKKREYEAAVILKQLLEAVSHLHSRNIVHRDIKIDNVLIKKNKKLDIRLIDFDISTVHDEKEQEFLTKQVGTRAYMAPEVLNRQYSKACDLWSLGIITHLLLSGEMPFSAATTEELCSQIHNQPVDFSAPLWEHISKEAKHFITRCLNKDPTQRAGVDELLTHDWMDTLCVEQSAYSPKPEKKRLQRIRNILDSKAHHKVRFSLFPPQISAEPMSVPVQ